MHLLLEKERRMGMIQISSTSSSALLDEGKPVLALSFKIDVEDRSDSVTYLPLCISLDDIPYNPFIIIDLKKLNLLQQLVGIGWVELFQFKLMLPAWLQEFDTLQQYLRSLFDCQCLSVDRIRATDEPMLQQSVKLLTSYGRKIMELSEQATYQHRNQHYLPRRQVEQELFQAYRNIIGEDAHPTTYEQMIKTINERMHEDRKSIWQKFSMPESRVVEIKRDERESRAEERQRSSLKEEEKNLRASKGKSRVSKNGAVRQALQIKGYLESEEDAIRQFFTKLGKMLETHKVPVGNLEQEAMKFTRVSEENGSDRISDLVRTSTQTHARNINNLCTMVELLHESLQKRLKNEGQAEGRLMVFIEEAKRMEQVYSYSLSKMLERLAQAKEALPSDFPSNHLQSLEEITRKLYGLYPSHENMQSLALKIRGEGKSYGVQVNVGKNQQERKPNGETFRLQARVGECLQRFERGNKHRKTFELKEVEKLMQNIREVLPSRQVKGQTEIAYQEQIRGLLELQEKREKETVEALGKKLKKAEKRVQELQIASEQLKRQWASTVAQWQQERKKFNKRTDSEQSQLKKMAKEKAALDASLSQYIQDIQRMRQQVRRQGDEEARLRRSLEREVSELKQECDAVRQRLKIANDEGKNERQQISEERALYRQKIQMTEKQLEQQRQLSAGLRLQIEAALAQHRESRAQLAQMRRIYEEKIRQLDGVIEHLHELQQVKIAQETAIQELQAAAQQHKQRWQTTQASLHEAQGKVRELLAQRNQLIRQAQHWKQEGSLTDSDLKQLREQVQKVSRAYLESEQLLDATRRELTGVSEQREKLLRERLRLTRLVQQLETQVAALKTKHQATELSERDLRDEYYQASQEAKRLQRQSEQLRKQVIRARKELQEQREERTKGERELRQLRQEQQGRKQAESVQQSRRRMEIQNLRMELRRKTEQAEKQQATYEEKLSMAQQKMKQLQEFAGQKHILSRLMHNHQSQ